MEKGVRTIDYESGVHTSLEAAVRRNIMGGLGILQEKITQRNHDELGCNGWEISAHANSAPDHEPIQGRQYSDAAYESLNNSLQRRIGTLNCGHAAFPIILGVNEPQYTKEQLEKFRKDNQKGVTVDGKHYTGYEATQIQQKLERAIRAQKRRILTAEAAGDQETVAVSQTRLHRLRQEYSRFSKAAGLRTENERTQVAGFGRKQAVVARTTVEKYSKVRYHKDGTVVVTDDWTQRNHPRMPQRYAPNAIVDTVSQNGRQRDRTFFDADGLQIRQVSNGPHGNRKRHPYGKNGEHAHDILWKDGKIVDRPHRELTDNERKECADIL